MRSSTQLGLFLLYIISLEIILQLGIDTLLGVLVGILFMGMSIVLLNIWDSKEEVEVKGK